MSHKFVQHRFLLHHMLATLHKALECISKNHKFIKRPVLTNSHKFLTRIKMLLYGNTHLYDAVIYPMCSAEMSAN